MSQEKPPYYNYGGKSSGRRAIGPHLPDSMIRLWPSRRYKERTTHLCSRRTIMKYSKRTTTNAQDDWWLGWCANCGQTVMVQGKIGGVDSEYLTYCTCSKEPQFVYVFGGLLAIDTTKRTAPPRILHTYPRSRIRFYRRGTQKKTLQYRRYAGHHLR